ncbi:MAG TPA: S1C family serine protease, partial [Kiloniellaceae bacterium]
MGENLARVTTIGGALGFSLLLSACNATAPLDIPEVGEAPTLSNVSIDFAPEATFALTKIVADIKRGEVIGAFPSHGIETEGDLCNHTSRGDDVITWGGGSRYLGNWGTELGTVFYETMSAQGYNIAGDPADMFRQEQSVQSAEYLVGARLRAIKSNFCHQHHWWDGRPLYEYSGVFYIDVEWSILNTLTQDVVYTAVHPGRLDQQKPIKDGIILMFHGAFADSVARLAADPEVDALAKGLAVAHAPARTTTGRYSVMNGRAGVGFDPDRMRNTVVTIRIGQGHGSGFFVGEAGLVVTNAHVVGEANTVQVRLNSGVELTGRVLARDMFRDVALVDTGIRFSTPPHLGAALPDVTTEVYAVGSPLRESLESTVTK